MPVKDGFVTVNVGGQSMKLLLDTGGFDLTVIDGGWYENQYGKGACAKSESGCYFCPAEAPCDFDNDPSTLVTILEDGRAIRTITRSATVALNGKVIRDFPFKVSVPESWNKTEPFHGFFGIADTPPKVAFESALKFLVRHYIVGRQSYTLRTNVQQSTQFITGELTLGDKVEKNKDSKYMFAEWHTDPDHHYAFPTISLSTTVLQNEPQSVGKSKGLRLGHSKPRLMSLVTGANGIYLPYKSILDRIETKIRRTMKKKLGYSEDKIGKMCYLGGDGFIHVKKEAYDSLPVLNLQLEGGKESKQIRIHPKHYTGDTGGEDVIIYINHFGKDQNMLGTPFFRAYTVHVDYTDNTIALLENP
ncbi:hypothetical protein Pmar_PMAR025662 [Perkinsus marinus ATCC 50983]|uniref:Peptidase A1 domain-containing protein n=1 Tax=Perkinsus marinus (strain ATCC 50983 / TXsc) TaxID=423536 RepID=C5KIN4_PERM5|nr:hypothetical protein Pmar_PMAR025662 [Perkinsus marinus ATCC 50983]EER15649.1 hypothetical protein Pmar_PMAR025662 [Perkinsus marinus ATCC 50983]|eukprot:XP_002783853.1 hypothetical protein Pmar_PMAR025662 [Perkinsus marinus ATCC 50983]